MNKQTVDVVKSLVNHCALVRASGNLTDQIMCIDMTYEIVNWLVTKDSRFESIQIELGEEIKALKNTAESIASVYMMVSALVYLMSSFTQVEQ